MAELMVGLHPISPDGAKAFRDVRLRALRDSPLAFGSTYAKESTLTDAEWVAPAAQWSSDRAAGFLAFDEDIACGIAAVFLDEDDSLRARLGSMWVAPENRIRGIGRLLVSAICRWATESGARILVLEVTSNNDNAIRFYERLGFAKTGRTLPYPNDPGLFEFEMERSLPCGTYPAR